jgi:hypothetical protein
MKKWGRIFNDSAADPPATRLPDVGHVYADYRRYFSFITI